MSERPELTMPRKSPIRERAKEIEEHNMSGHAALPKTHDDYLNLQGFSERHHPKNRKD